MKATSELEIRNRILSTGERFPFVVSVKTGLPDFDVTLHLLTQLRSRSLAASTLTGAARAIIFGSQVLELIGVDLDKRVSEDRILALGEIDLLMTRFTWKQERLKAQLKEKGRQLNEAPQGKRSAKILELEAARHARPKKNDVPFVVDDTTKIRLLYFRNFVEWKVQGKLSSLSSTSSNQANLRHSLEFFVTSINARMAKSPARCDLDLPEGLSDPEVKKTHEVTALDSPENPWKSKSVQIRNRLIFQVLLNLGLRKGELLGLKVDDINFRANELTIHRRADDPADPRSVQPNAKTNARVLPIDPELARGLHGYLVKHRDLIGRARFHPFLFVANGSGAPLSISAVDRVFRDIKNSSPTFDRLSPHILRHTWNDKFSEVMDAANIDENKESEARAYAMGWKSGSDTAKTYTRRHIRKRALDASLKLQEKYAKASKAGSQ